MPVTRKWSDLDLDFTAHPNTGDLSIKRDADAVVRSIRYLMLTNHYERPFHPEIGSDVTKQLFEPMTYATVLRLKEAIRQTINNYEPRVQISRLEVEPRTEADPLNGARGTNENGYLVDLRFFLINEEVERQTVFFLERNR